MSASVPFDPVITVSAWIDPVIDDLGFDPTSAYVEYAWLPRTGPSATWCYRRLTAGLRPAGEPYQLELAYLAHCLGLGAGTARNSPLQRTLLRLVSFGLARQLGDSELAVRRRAPWLNLASVRRLDPRLQRVHEGLMAAHRPLGDAAAS